MLTEDTELPVPVTMADENHRLKGCHLRAPGDPDPSGKHSLAGPIVLCSFPDSALCSGAWALRTASPGPPIFWLVLASGRCQQEPDRQVCRQLGLFLLYLLPALGMRLQKLLSPLQRQLYRAAPPPGLQCKMDLGITISPVYPFSLRSCNGFSCCWSKGSSHPWFIYLLPYPTKLSLHCHLSIHST